MISLKKIALVSAAALTSTVLLVPSANANILTLTVNGSAATGGTAATAPVALPVPADNSVDLADVYPSSGLGRLLYINENNLTHFNFSIFNFTKKFYFLLKIIQIILFLIFLLLIIFCSLNLIKKKELRGKN